MKNKFIIAIIIPLFFGLAGCEALDGLDDKKVTDPEVSVTYPINGEYFVTLDMFDAAENVWVRDVYGYGYVKIMFSNTANNDKDKVWFDDLKFWPSRAKINCDPANSSFTAGTYNANFAEAVLKPSDTSEFHTDHPIEFKAFSLDKNAVKDSVLVSGYGIMVKIFEGFIMKDMVVAPSKFVTDSINIQLEWSDDPGTKYRYAGFRRTGFLEDEH